jgi:hypothetical protein
MNNVKRILLILVSIPIIAFGKNNNQNINDDLSEIAFTNYLNAELSNPHGQYTNLMTKDEIKKFITKFRIIISTNEGSEYLVADEYVIALEKNPYSLRATLEFAMNLHILMDAMQSVSYEFAWLNNKFAMHAKSLFSLADIYINKKANMKKR